MNPFDEDRRGGGGRRPGGQPPFGQPPFGQPPFGQPSFDQPSFGQPSFGQPSFGQQPGGIQPPSAPPPSFTPQQFTTTQQQEFGRRGGVGSIRRCMFRNTFMWMRNGNSFWFFPMFIVGNSIIGFRWRGGRRGWVYDSINRNNILFFQCY